MRPYPPGRRGFTLMEVCLAIFIAMLIVLLAVPSITGVLEEQRARKLFSDFDAMAREAGTRAVTERRPFVLVWDDSGVALRPMAPGPGETTISRVDFGDRLAPEIMLPAALVEKPEAIWPFWPTGTCEPATIICHVPGSEWTAKYDPLTEQPTFTTP